MEYMKFSLCVLLMITMTMMTFSSASRKGEKIHFQHSSETDSYEIDERPGNDNRNRNHRGRGRGYQKHMEVTEFEQGIPGVYPIRGPPQAPLILPTHPGQGVGLQKNKFVSYAETQKGQQVSGINSEAPIFSMTSHVVSQPAQQPLNKQYDYNPFLNNVQSSTQNVSVSVFGGVTTSDKAATTTPSYQNPRRTDLLYGSNLLEEGSNRDAKASQVEDVEFDGRGLFDTAPRCKNGQILVNNRCRIAV